MSTLTRKDTLTAYFNSGITSAERLGVEIEHFILNADDLAVPYSGKGGVEEILGKHMSEYPDAKADIEGSHLIGFSTENFKVSLEPGAQYEVSIVPFESIAEIRHTYDEFCNPLKRILKEYGYRLCTEGCQPITRPEDIELIPKKRYQLMDAYFRSIGTDAIEMMRGTAALQVSVDYSSEQDCIRKMRAAQLLTPVLQLLTDNTYRMSAEDSRGPLYLKRAEIWSRTDPDRCEVAHGLFDESFGFDAYADYLCSAPLIVDDPADDPGHVSSMFFPDVRLRQYIEIRGADSMKIDMAIAYAALIKGIMYSARILDDCEKLIASRGIKDEDIISARKEIMAKGWEAEIYGKNAAEFAQEIIEAAAENLIAEEEKLLEPMRYRASLPGRIKREYAAMINDHPDQWAEEGRQIKEDPKLKILSFRGNYSAAIAAVPEIIDKEREDIFKEITGTCYGICEKVIREYRTCPDYRKMFPFPKELEELMLAGPVSDCMMPMARFDLFYHYDTGEYKIGEINTDGTASMNEDRICAQMLAHYTDHRNIAEKYQLETYELFDSWVQRFIEIYRDTVSTDTLPNVAILDFLDLGYVTEFIEFRDRFRKAGVNCEVCEIRDLEYRDGRLYSADGFRIDAVYRRAVTGDIMRHYDQVQPFVQAVRDRAVFPVGGICTQVIHHKSFFCALHDERTLSILTEKEREFVKRHIPETFFFNKENVDLKKIIANKDRYVIKPCDSYGTAGVICGPMVDEETWRKGAQAAYGTDSICQEYCSYYTDGNTDFALGDGRWHMQNTVTGLYVYGGKFAGVYTRQNNVGRIVGGGYPTRCLPCFRIR